MTGATRGIGRALSIALARAGAELVLVGRDAARLGEVEAEFESAGLAATSIVADVRDTAALGDVFALAAARRGHVDILVNNAGIESPRASADVDEALWDLILDTNLKAAFFCAQAAARTMPAGGVILNVCSLTSEVGVPCAAAYTASKSGLAGVTRTLATEWAGRGIRVNGIGPGYFRTALTEAFYTEDGWQTAMLQKIPLRRFGRLEELGGAAVFLCSDAASYITGQIVYIDGGYLAAL